MKDEGPQDQPWPVPYERPNQKWLCGRTDDVFPCPLGPDGRGQCRTTSECSPVLEKKPGEEKGRYRCTRRAEYGGPCGEGPLPDGSCSHARPPCSPVRSMRRRRALFTYWLLGLTIAALLLLFHGTVRYQFANPGPLSSAHFRPKGVQAARYRGGIENCSACHRDANDGLRKWVEAAAGAKPHPFRFAEFLHPAPRTPTAMDQRCADCHRGHQFHSGMLQQEQSCLQCHLEHRGDEGLIVKTAEQCVNCHGDVNRMNEVTGGLFAAVATGNPASSRPSAPITRFSRDHPEFGPLARKMSDPNPLRFNHQKHLTNPVVGADGKPLDCASCHQEDTAGEYHRRIRFEQHCQSCHSLQFDPETPELQLPHGEVEFVKAFIGSLPRQYEQYAERVRGITEKRALKTFVDAQMRRLEERQLAGTALESDIFLSRSRKLPPSGHIVPFYGCAYCHEVTGQGNGIQVAKADVPLRWLTKGAFHHRAHQNVTCTTCHNAPASLQTTDILLPSVKVCARCHRSNAAPGETCKVCHDYHHWKDQLATVTVALP
jgi:hypothetical protein